MHWGLLSRLGVVTAVVVALTTGLVLGAGTTTVAVQPDSATVSAGETTTVDIVVESADDGVGSIDLELAVSDAQVANITDVSVAGDPSTVRTTSDNDSTRIAATGMNTADTGSVTVATVTLEGEASGTTSLDLTVAAVGNESGSSYDVSDTTNGELTVEGDSDSTEDDGPTAVAYGPRETTAGTTVTFNASNSTSETADGIESYEWRFGDGTTANGSVVTHTYNDTGTYRVYLTVTDSNGFDEDTTGIVVDPASDDSQTSGDDGGSTGGNTDGGDDTSENKTTDSTNTSDTDTDGDTDSESALDDDTDESGTPTPETVTPTPTVTETSASQTTTDTVSTQSPSATSTSTDTTATEPSSLRLVPLAVIGGVVIVVAGLIYYRRE